MRLVLLAMGLAMAPEPQQPPAPPPMRPVLRVAISRPDLQLERLLALFRGSRAPDPAAAMAAWKRATAGAGSLGKAAEAAIAALNPRMAPELKTLDGAVFCLDFGPDDRATWSLAVPRDDGTLAAFATATALTDGATEPAYEGLPVDRLGGEGSALMVRKGSSVILAASRSALPMAIESLTPVGDGAARPGADDRATPSLVATLDAEGLSRSGGLVLRRLGAALAGLGARSPVARLGLEGGRLVASIDWRTGARSAASRLDPSWARDLPSGATLAFATAIDPSPPAWDRRFAALDAVEKADPRRRDTAPARVRLNLLARAAGLDPERDLWPHVRGVSGYLTGPIRAPEAVGVVLHMTDPASARRVREVVLPALAKSVRSSPSAPKGGVAPLATAFGRPVFVLDDAGAEVRIAWGEEARRVALSLRDDPRSSLQDRTATGDEVSDRAWIWPQRLGLAPAGSALEWALAESPPILSWGIDRGGGRTHFASWDGLPVAIRRYLDRIPQAPLPDPAR